MNFIRLLFLGAWAVFQATAVAADDKPPRSAIVWDAMEKTVVAAVGDGVAAFNFKATNTSNHTVTISSVRPSCGCTVVDLPATPWVLAPGASGLLAASVSFEGKEGTLTKSMQVELPEGAQTLVMHVKIPQPDETQRIKNQQLALANRQAVFQGECASCHATPAAGKTGEDLFKATCEVCHTATQRASMVPDLLVARDRRDAGWWRAWITEGKPGSLMPSFTGRNGGPLNDAQIESLVKFALASLPTEPRSP